MKRILTTILVALSVGLTKRPSRLVVANIMGAVALIALAAWGIAPLMAKEEPIPAQLALVTLELNAPPSIGTGTPFQLTIDGVSTGEAVEVMVRGPYGSRSFELVADASSVVVTIDEAGSGLFVIDAISPRGTGTTTVEILPGDAVGPLDLYVGPRTVVADGLDFSMLVAVPIDRFGNPVADGTVVGHRVIQSDGSIDALEAETSGLLSFIRIDSITVSGRTNLAVGVGDADGPARSFENVAGVPVPFTLQPASPADSLDRWFADGATLRTLKTDVLADRFANVVPDGTAVQMRAEGPDGIRLLSSTTVAGVARFVIEAPIKPGTMTLTATAADSPSAALTIEIQPAVETIPVLRTRSSDDVVFTIGPVLTQDGFFVPDGTLATVTIGDVAHVVVLEQGMAQLSIRETPLLGEIDSDPGPTTVEILGVQSSAIEDRGS